MLKKWIFICLLISPVVFAANMAYVGVNSHSLANAGCFVRSDNGKPFFDIAAIFAGNINGNSPNDPKIFFNDNVKATLDSNQIALLHQKGIKVLMTLLGNHQNAGWSCMTNEKSASSFANKIVNMINAYHLDGVDIDDEYSYCVTNNFSLIMLAYSIKTNPSFKGKLLTKALFYDSNYFKATYEGHHLADFLDIGWEMSYYDTNFSNRLAVYLANGMSFKNLMIGAWTDLSNPDPYQLGQYAARTSLKGVMIFNVTDTSQAYLTQILKGELNNNNVTVNIMPHCLH